MIGTDVTPSIWDRGTEHVAETIAWALADDPHHVEWVETLPDGSKQTTHRILTLGVDVGTLLDNFEHITGMDPVFRHANERTVDEGASTAISPELARLGGRTHPSKSGRSHLGVHSGAANPADDHLSYGLQETP